jgi:glutathione gamma-glutamylcysteinyltransferase
MQTGTGHFSPIAAYEAESDMVLVLDVASFKYRPYFVSLPVLYQAMFPLDSVTGKSRGFVVMKKSESDVHSSIHANTNMQPLSAITVEFARTVQSAASQIRADLSSSDEDMKFTVKTLLEAVPQDLNDRLRSFTYRIIMGACGDHRTAINSLLAEIRRTRMYALTTEALKKSPRYVLAPELASVLLLSFPESVFSNLPVPALERLRSLRSMEDMGAVLMSEIIQLRTDLHSMCSSGDSCALKHGSVQCTC